jgi:hypothetical protein
VTYPFRPARARALASRARFTVRVPPESWTSRLPLTRPLSGDRVLALGDLLVDPAQGSIERVSIGPTRPTRGRADGRISRAGRSELPCALADLRWQPATRALMALADGLLLHRLTVDPALDMRPAIERAVRALAES